MHRFLLKFAKASPADRAKAIHILQHPQLDQAIANWHSHWANLGLATAEDDDEWALSCKRCLDDSAWDFPLGAELRWLTCGPLGNGCITY